MNNKYQHHKGVVKFYRFKDMDRSEAIQEAYSRGFCAGADSIPRGNETKEELRKTIFEQQKLINEFHMKADKILSILKV